uniref:CCR4-NOT transcription complex subunit 11 n=1 Tax=Panagrolaimus sp. ES5 TaxID=591445 RepID=A0AC34GSS2_9BILA
MESPKYPPEAVHAQIADTMLNTSLQLTSYLENYFEHGNPAIIKISLDLVKNVNLDLVPQRVRLMTTLLVQTPIKESEFPIFCHICFCKLVFHGLAEEKQAKMKNLQRITMQTLSDQMNQPSRFQELSNLSQNFVTTFYANL